MSKETSEPELGMRRERFWEIIEASRIPKPASVDDHCSALKKQLTTLSREDLIAFADAFNLVHEELNDFHLWAAADILNHGCSDDGFEDFKSWIITLGSVAYHAALENPDSIADQLAPGYMRCEAELFGYVAGEVYEERYDDYLEVPFYAIPFANEMLSLKAAQEKFPRLSALAQNHMP